MSQKALVIGSGLGGLSAAATLAKNGVKVHLIEAHDKVGGFATNYRRGKYRMESGIHLLAGDHEESLYHEIFEYFEINKNVPLVKPPLFYKCFVNDKSYEIPFEIEACFDYLAKKFPESRAELIKYFEVMEVISKQFKEHSLRKPFIAANSPFFSAFYSQLSYYWKMSIGTFLDGIITHPDLKMVLLANVTFYHNNPYELSLVMFMISQMSYMQGGGYYVQGGSQIFSDYLKNIILNNNGTVTLKHKACEFIVKGKAITDVNYAKVTKPGDVMTEGADYVVMNGARPEVFENLVKGHSFKVQEPELGISANTVYFGLNKPLSALGSTAYMQLFLQNKANYLSLNANKESYGLIDYSFMDTKLCADGVYCCEVIQMDHMSQWSTDENEYKKQKQMHLESVMEFCESQFKGFKDSVIFTEVSTPQTVKRYVHTPQGVIYGYKPTPDFFTKQASQFSFYQGAKDQHLNNLYYASAWSFLPGFTGTLIAGYKAAREILSSR